MADSSQPEARNSFDPDAESMRRIGYELIDQIVEHMSTLSDQRVAKRGSGESFAELVDEQMQDGPKGLNDCLDFYFRQVVPGMTRVNHPRFHAFIPCPSSFPGMVGAMLAAGTNPFVGSWLGGATVASLELTVLRWIKELLQLDPSCEGILTSGGSMANLVGLAAARAKFGDGMLEKGTLYFSGEGHASAEKAALVLGFNKDNIRVVEVDSEYRMRTQHLEDQIEVDLANGLKPFFVATNAGTTNTGSIDPLDEVASICKRRDLWFHVDAAYGGFAAMVPEIREQMAGLELADSITLDPHKWLYCPMGVGCAFVREQQYLHAAFSTHGSYLKDLTDDEVNFLERGPELSRPARVLPVWMVLRSVGRTELVDQIRADVRLAEHAASLLAEDERFEVEPVRLSIAVFRHNPLPGEPEAERAMRDTELIEAILADGELMLSSTTLNGKSTLRFVVMNHRTTVEDVERSVRRIRELASLV